MGSWSETIVLRTNTTVTTKQDELLLCLRGEWLGKAEITISRVGSPVQKQEMELGDEFRYGPYTFGTFEVRLMQITEESEENDESVTVLVSLLG